MPHYHFNLHNRIGFVPDEEGRDLLDLETARAEALKGARSLIAEEVLGGRLDLAGRLEIVELERRAACSTVAFAEAVEIAPPHEAD